MDQPISWHRVEDGWGVFSHLGETMGEKAWDFLDWDLDSGPTTCCFVLFKVILDMTPEMLSIGRSSQRNTDIRAGWVYGDQRWRRRCWRNQAWLISDWSELGCFVVEWCGARFGCEVLKLVSCFQAWFWRFSGLVLTCFWVKKGPKSGAGQTAGHGGEGDSWLDGCGKDTPGKSPQPTPQEFEWVTMGYTRICFDKSFYKLYIYIYVSISIYIYTQIVI